jgi:galactonate dehydratase
MQITAIETVTVDEFPNLTFLVVHTDTGLRGLGETFYGAAAVEAHIHAVLAPALIGTDPLRISAIGRSSQGYVGYAGSGVETRARSALDLALWDILGKQSGQPVYNLIGGRTRADVEIYNTCAGSNYVNAASGQSVSNWGVREGLYEDLSAAITRPGELAEELLDMGIGGMKIWPFDGSAERRGGNAISSRELADGLRPLQAIRDSVGGRMDIMVELHALWDVPSAQRIVRAMEEFDVFWVEDPVRSDIPDGLARVADSTSIRIAAGESVGGMAGFHSLLQQGAVGVVTVDTTWSGGLTTARDVAALAEMHGVPIAPHDCTGPVALAACVHLAVSAPNVLVQETVRAAYLGWYGSLVEGGPSILDGRIQPTTTPGLGISLRPDVYERPTTHRRVTGRV